MTDSRAYPSEIEPSEDQPGRAGGRIDAETARLVSGPTRLPVETVRVVQRLASYLAAISARLEHIATVLEKGAERPMTVAASLSGMGDVVEQDVRYLRILEQFVVSRQLMTDQEFRAIVAGIFNQAQEPQNPAQDVPPADGGAHGPVEQVKALLEQHQVEWIDGQLGWDCGCNEQGTLPGMPTVEHARQHQAEALLSALRRPDDDRRTKEADSLRRLARALLLRLSGPLEVCEVTGNGYDRCKEPVSAARFEHGFLDLVCEQHADSAEGRGALVVRTTEKD